MIMDTVSNFKFLPKCIYKDVKPASPHTHAQSALLTRQKSDLVLL